MNKKIPVSEVFFNARSKNIKKVGIYRIWIEYKEEEYSYIGESINIISRVNTHRLGIKKFLINKNNVYSQWLKRASIPADSALYWKIASFLIYTNLNIDQVYFEILEDYKNNNVSKRSREKIELTLIKKYNSEKKGFNGIFAKSFKILGALTHGINLSEDEKKYLSNLYEEEKEKNFKISKELSLIKKKHPKNHCDGKITDIEIRDEIKNFEKGKWEKGMMPWLSRQLLDEKELSLCTHYFNIFCFVLLWNLRRKIKIDLIRNEIISSLNTELLIMIPNYITDEKNHNEAREKNILSLLKKWKK